MEDQEPFESGSFAITSPKLEWQAACRLREEEALVLLKEERLRPLAGKVMLVAPISLIPHDFPRASDRKALILWGVKRQLIRILFQDLQGEMDVAIRAIGNGVSSSIDYLIDGLYRDELTYAGFASERTRVLETYKTTLAALKAELAKDDPRRDRHIVNIALL
jgi:hypothetical protein